MSHKEGCPSNDPTRQESPSKVVQLRKFDRKNQQEQLRERHKPSPTFHELVQNRIFDAGFSVDPDFEKIQDKPDKWGDEVKAAAIKEARRIFRELHAECDYMVAEYGRYLLRLNVPIWMIEDKIIGKALEKRPVIWDYLKYLYERNAYARGNEYNLLVKDKADDLTNGKKYKGKWDYSVYVADAHHYERAARNLGHSKDYIRKLNEQLVREGIFPKISEKQTGKRGRPASIIADGYFVKTDGKLRKVSFCTEEKRKALRRAIECLP